MPIEAHEPGSEVRPHVMDAWIAINKTVILGEQRAC
jgi:hypothetical protein